MNSLYKFELVQVGSSVEGTRPFPPEDFDFLLVCKNMEQNLDITQETNTLAVVKLKPDADVPE